jgi:carboxypeptidase Q
MSLSRQNAFCIAAALVAVTIGTQAQSRPNSGWVEGYRETAGRLMRAATADDFAWQRLAELGDTYGNRLSGSENLARAIAWAAETMKKDGLENVRTEPVMVPRWVRGNESAEIVDPPRHQVAMLGLGGSIATPPGGLEADVLVVNSFDELRSHAALAKGRIVPVQRSVHLIQRHRDVPHGWSACGRAARRGRGAHSVGRADRVADAAHWKRPVRQGVPAIPAASIAAEDANRIARLVARGRRVRLRLSMEAHNEPDAESANVVGEIRGREKPEEIVLLGGHIDSWDVGAGASDDGVGIVATWEAARLMAKLGIRPRRTVRVVLWTNEENGLQGATAYAEKHAAEAPNHVFALESDSGVFEPASLGFSGSNGARTLIRDIWTLLTPLGIPRSWPVAAAPTSDRSRKPRTRRRWPILGDPSKYFTIHHTPADTVERIAPRRCRRRPLRLR